MQSKTTRRFYMGSICDIKALEHHFELMADKGYMIEKIGTTIHRYRITEPCKKRFFVDLLPQITAFDYPDNEDAQEYRRLCEDSGWTFITANKQLHVFCAEEGTPDIIPIHTDEKIQAQMYLKASRKYELPIFFFSLFLFYIVLPFGRGIDMFLSNILLFQALGFCVFLVGYAWSFGYVLRWNFLTGRAVKRDLKMPEVNYRLMILRNRVFSVGVFTFLLCSALGFIFELIGGMPAPFILIGLIPISGLAVGLWIRRQIDTKERGRTANKILFIVTIVVMEVVFVTVAVFVLMNVITSSRFNTDELGNRPALTLSSIGIESPPRQTSTDIKGSIAVPVQYDHWEINNEGNVRTEVYTAVIKPLANALFEHYAAELIDSFNDYRAFDGEIFTKSGDDAQYWDAERSVEVYTPGGKSVEIILLRGKTVLHLSLYGENTLQAIENKELWNRFS